MHKRRWVGEIIILIIIIIIIIFGEMTSVTTKRMEASPTLSLFLPPPLRDPSSTHMATRAGLGIARALARIGGATRTCKQRGIAQRHHSVENKLVRRTNLLSRDSRLTSKLSE